MAKLKIIHHNNYILVQLSHKGSRRRFATGYKVKDNQFKSGTVKNHSYAFDMNAALRSILSKGEEVIFNSRPLDIESVSNAIRRITDEATGRSELSGENILQLIAAYIEARRNEVSQATINKFKSLGEIIKKYNKDLKISEMDKRFFDRFTRWMTTHKLRNRKDNEGGMLDNTIAVYCNKLRNLLSWCESKGYEVSPDYKKFKWQTHSREVNYLSEAELLKVYAFEPDQPHLKEIRDVFCFACWTGLRYSDLKALSIADIHDNSLRLRHKKTKKEVIVPLNKYSREIIERWNSALPVTNNPNSNLHIKQLLKTAGIDAPVKRVMFRGNERIEVVKPKYDAITIHDARRTFACLMLIKGVPAHVVMKMGGWASYSSFKKYIDIAESVSTDYMTKAWG